MAHRDSNLPKNYISVNIRWTGCQINLIKFHEKDGFLLKKIPWGSFFFKGTTPIQDDYGKFICDIEKRFFAFNCQLKKLNREILLSWFDIRFTGYKPECNFLVGSNLGGPKFFFLKISRKVEFLCFFVLISRLSTH